MKAAYSSARTVRIGHGSPPVSCKVDRSNANAFLIHAKPSQACRLNTGQDRRRAITPGNAFPGTSRSPGSTPATVTPIASPRFRGDPIAAPIFYLSKFRFPPPFAYNLSNARAQNFIRRRLPGNALALPEPCRRSRPSRSCRRYRRPLSKASRRDHCFARWPIRPSGASANDLLR